ncbi:MAG TPA: cob(I)yrinic acid a,c-diamide adenosyltransferase [Candidatus Dormibacteraeota bacterium]|nr:cob(I)yrinic acid a,c-diamide adenosyltransferase [Candidatus Dormibacteraeota bacterium]
MPERRRAMHELAGGGDDGSTGLLGGGRVAKDDLRIEVYGTVDEASSAIGLAKALTSDERVREIAEQLQRGLYRLGAELATNPADTGKFGATSETDVAGLDDLLATLEAEVEIPRGFILPGSTPASGALDLARTVVRRAERRCVTLMQSGGLANSQARRYLNRLSLVLFVLGRFEEARAGHKASPARRGA